MKRFLILAVLLTLAACQSYPDGKPERQVVVPTPLATEVLPNKQAEEWVKDFVTQKFIKYSNQSNQVYTLRHADIIQIDNLHYSVWNHPTRPTNIDLKNDIDWAGYLVLNAEAVRKFDYMNNCWMPSEEWISTTGLFKALAEIAGFKKQATPGNVHVYFEMYREVQNDPKNPSLKKYVMKCKECELYKDPTQEEVQKAVDNRCKQEDIDKN